MNVLGLISQLIIIETLRLTVSMFICMFFIAHYISLISRFQSNKLNEDQHACNAKVQDKLKL